MTSVGGVLEECTSLKEVNISNFNDNKTMSMDRIFSGCTSLQKVDISNFYNNEK